MPNLTDRAELLEVIAVLVDAMRRADPEYTLVHGCEPCSDDDWNTALAAGEDAIEANEGEPQPGMIVDLPPPPPPPQKRVIREDAPSPWRAVWR